MANTPTPWKVGYRALSIFTEDDEMKICDIRGWGHLTGGGALNLPPDEAEAIQTANANLICKAVNSHDALISALEDTVQALTSAGQSSNWKDTMSKAENVLKLAKGEE